MKVVARGENLTRLGALYGLKRWPLEPDFIFRIRTKIALKKYAKACAMALRASEDQIIDEIIQEIENESTHTQDR
jgi:hypothetical protein